MRIKNMKLKNKLLILLSAALLAVFCMTLCSSYLPYGAYDEQLYISSVQTLSLFAAELQEKLDYYADCSFHILADDVFQENLTAMRKNTARSEEWLVAYHKLNDHFASYANTIENVVSFRLETVQNCSFSYFWGTSVIKNEDIVTLAQKARDAQGSEVWVTLPEPVSRLILVRDIREVDGLTFTSLGTVFLEIDLEKVVASSLKVMEELDCPLSAAIYDGTFCLYSSNDYIDFPQMDEDGYRLADSPDGKVLYTRYTASQGWHFIAQKPFYRVRQQIQWATQQALFLSLLAVVVTIVLGTLIINIILRHLQVLLQKIDNFSKGKLPSEQEITPYRERRDEMGRLHRHFDRMITEYDHMVRDNYEKQLAIKDAQARHLRAQIRPHFLYNTLQSIYFMAKEARQERIAGMTDALGKMMHASINERKDVITIREDWEIAREYLRIQQFRYQDHLDIHYELDQQLEDIRIPSMTLQPLVENAVHYAAEEMLDVCRIRIWGKENADSVDICVEDNGPGMDEDILNKLERGEVKPDGLGIGLSNIHRRIQLEFAPEYGLRIRCGDGCTQVFIHLPKTREGNGHD